MKKDYLTPELKVYQVSQFRMLAESTIDYGGSNAGSDIPKIGNVKGVTDVDLWGEGFGEE